MKKTIYVGVLGYGTVGSAVVRLLQKNHALIASRTGISIKVKAIAEISPSKRHNLIVRDALKVINDPEISIIIETTGREKEARKYILAAFKAGKHVVTPNKEVISKYFLELSNAAAQAKVSLLFEAAVGGGIPIIRAITENLAANEIKEVFGIVNGTTNYILSKMTKEGSSFDQALNQAKLKGYAEPDPSADINGNDALYKAVILASTAFGAEVDWQKVYFEGIGKIKTDDIRYASDMGYVIKLLAVAKKVNEELEVRVHPTLVPKEHPLAKVDENYNAIYVKGDAAGEVMFYGQGAGGQPTASAIVGDIISIADEVAASDFWQIPQKLPLKKMGDIESRYYLRLLVPDRYGVLSGISGAFAKEKVSIQAVMQKETIGDVANLIIVLHKVAEKNLNAALSRIKRLSVVKEISNVIRVGLE